MADIKISELEPTTDLEGLFTIGSDKNNLSKKVALQFLKDAANYANMQGDYAKEVGDSYGGKVANLESKNESNSLESLSLDDTIHAAKAWNYYNKLSLASANSNWRASGYIPLPDSARSGFSIFNVRCHTGSAFYPAYLLDENLKYIKYLGTGAEGDTAISELVVSASDIPSNAKYVIFNGQHKNQSYCSFSKVKSELIDFVKSKGKKSINLAVDLIEKIGQAWCGKPGNVIAETNANSPWRRSYIFDLSESYRQGFYIKNATSYANVSNIYGCFFLDKEYTILSVIDFDNNNGGDEAESGTRLIDASEIPSDAVLFAVNTKSENLEIEYSVKASIENLERLTKSEIDLYYVLPYYETGKALTSSGANTATGSWGYTDYFEITNDAKALGLQINNVRYYDPTYSIGYFYDSNKNVIKKIKSYPSGEGFVESVFISDIPANAAYLRLNGDVTISEPSIRIVSLKAQISHASESVKVDSVDLLTPISENPLAVIKREPGFASIFTNWGFVGDSLASGEYNCYKDGKATHYDAYEFSWGQFICRATGAEGYNFSNGGQTANGWITESGERTWNGAKNNPKTSYIIALGHNDKSYISDDYPVGTIADIDMNDYNGNANSFVGDYAGIIQRLRSIQPNVPIFCTTTYKGWGSGYGEINNAIRQIVEMFDHVYLIDMYEHFPSISGEWSNRYRNSSHFTAQGYLEVAWGLMTYIDWIVRNNWQSFKNQGLIGTDYTLTL